MPDFDGFQTLLKQRNYIQRKRRVGFEDVSCISVLRALIGFEGWIHVVPYADAMDASDIARIGLYIYIRIKNRQCLCSSF
jgi:hypothetical protein